MIRQVAAQAVTGQLKGIPKTGVVTLKVTSHNNPGGYIMKLSFSKRELTRSTVLLNPYIPAKTTLPILSGAFIEASESGIAFTGTDSEVGIQVDVDGEVIEPGIAVMPLKDFRDIIKTLKPTDPVLIETQAGNRIDIIANGVTHRLISLDEFEYPKLRFASKPRYKLDGAVFRSLMDTTAYASSTEETRYFLHGVYFNLTAEKSEFVGCDGRRLAMSTYKALVKSDPIAEIVPLIAVKRMMKTFAKSEWVRFGIAKAKGKDNVDRMCFTDGTARISTRLIQGEYPKYEQIIPKNNEHRIIANVSELASGVDQMLAVPFTGGAYNKKESRAVFDFSSESVTLSAKSRHPDHDVSAESVVPLIKGNGDIKMGFDTNYFADVLSHISTDEVSIELHDALSAAIIKPVGETNHIALVMPQRVE